MGYNNLLLGLDINCFLLLTECSILLPLLDGATNLLDSASSFLILYYVAKQETKCLVIKAAFKVEDGLLKGQD